MLPEENKKPIHFEEVATSAEQPVSMKRKEQFIPSSSSSSSTIMPINQRTCNDIRRWNIDDQGLQNLKLLARFLRHQGYPQEDDGAIEWREVLLPFYREHFELQKWTM